MRIPWVTMGLGVLLTAGFVACNERVASGVGAGGGSTGDTTAGTGNGPSLGSANMDCETPPALATRGNPGFGGFGPIPEGCAAGMPVVIVCGSTPGDFVGFDDAHAYWLKDVSADEGQAAWEIVRTPKTGGEAEAVASGPGFVERISIDDARIHWVAWGNDGVCALESAPKSGGPIQVDLPAAAHQVLQVAVADSLFVLKGDLDQKKTSVYAVPKAGGAATLLGEGGAGLITLPPAVDADRVYWVDEAGLLSMPRAGGPITVVVPLDQVGFANGLLVDDQRLYWSVPYQPGTNDGIINSAPKTGGAVTQLATAKGQVYGLVADAQCLYWTETGAFDTQYDGIGVVAAVAKGGGLPALIDTWDESGNFGIGLSIDGDGLLLDALGAAVDPGPNSTAPPPSKTAGHLIRIPRH